MPVFQLGSIIRNRREELGLSQEDLADGVCSVPTLSRIENGERMPTKNHYEMLMQRLGYSSMSLDFFTDKKDFLAHEAKIKLRYAYISSHFVVVFRKTEKYIYKLPMKFFSTRKTGDMEMCYNGNLMMPSGFSVVNSNEMEYIDGGWSHTITGTLSSITRRLSDIVMACVVGNVLSIALGAVGELACKIIGAASASWFTNTLSKTSAAHEKAELWSKQYGKNRKCKMTSSWAVIWCTGVSLSLC